MQLLENKDVFGVGYELRRMCKFIHIPVTFPLIKHSPQTLFEC